MYTCMSVCVCVNVNVNVSVYRELYACMYVFADSWLANNPMVHPQFMILCP